MKFSDYRISPDIKSNLESMGFKRPTDIQYKSIPAILNGEDVLAIAQTGTGKTASFAIPILHIIQERKKKNQGEVRCLIMVPTRELALQINEAIEKMGKGTKVKSTAIVGGVSQTPQIAQLAKGTDIVVATPGRLFDLYSQGHLKLDRVEILILDEADHMLDLGFIHDIRAVTTKIPKQRQTLFFSATIDEHIKKLAYSLVKRAIRIQISPKNPVAKNISHAVAFIEMNDKRFFLERLINENDTNKILVFVRTKVRAERLYKAMERVGLTSATIHGGKDQNSRLNVMNEFRQGNVKVLIATDISARGIDIPGVDQVVNYDIPQQPENYVHRVGRTGRGKEKGLAISFCSNEEKETLEEIEKYLGHEINVLSIEKDDYEQTMDFSEEHPYDWKSLINEEPPGKKRSKHKKRK